MQLQNMTSTLSDKALLAGFEIQVSTPYTAWGGSGGPLPGSQVFEHFAELLVSGSEHEDKQMEPRSAMPQEHKARLHRARRKGTHIWLCL